MSSPHPGLERSASTQPMYRNDDRSTTPLGRTRSLSVSSDGITSKSNPMAPPSVDPPPAFVAPSPAIEVIRSNLEQDESIAGDGDNVAITPGALALLNGFLDNLLFQFLATAKSTQLSALRPAIADVLKPRLAKEVVAAADDELGEYLAGGDDEDFRGGQGPPAEFDLIRSWKLTRLRCMVYTRLGDMEEDEEDEYIARDGLDEASGAPRRFGRHAGTVTPAGAIFLTAIIEYLAEHALAIATENARNRLGFGREPTDTDALEVPEQLTIEDADLEKLALNTTLGRLWRAWKKRVRGPISQPHSKDSSSRRGTRSRKTSVDAMDEPSLVDSAHDQQSEKNDVEPSSELATNDQDDDVDTRQGDSVPELQPLKATAAVVQKVRPKSLTVTNSGLPTPASSSASEFPENVSADGAKDHRHNRTWSLPSRPHEFETPDATPVDEEKGDLSAKKQQSLGTMHETEEQNVEAASAQRDVTEASEHHEEQVDRSHEQSSNRDSRQMPRKSRFIEDISDPQDRAAVEKGPQSPQVYNYEGGQVIEGRGTYEVPKLSNLPAQRPKRKPSKPAMRKGSSSALGGESDTSSIGRPDDSSSTPDAGTARSSLRSASAQEAVGRAEDRQPTAVSRQSSDHVSTSQPPQSQAVPVDGRSRYPTSGHVHGSAHYSDNIGRYQSTPDDSDHAHRARTPSRSAPQAAPGTSSARHSSGDQSPGVERAAVQRVIVPSTSQQSVHSRRSGSISERRPVTAGSTTSSVSNKLRGLIGLHSGDGDSPSAHRPRKSSDTNRSFRSDLADSRSDLDRLIESNETLRYTLTPRNMRNIEVPSSPRQTGRTGHIAESDTAELADFLRNTGPPGDSQGPRGMSGSRDVPAQPPRQFPDGVRINGLRAHPPDDLLAETRQSVSSSSSRPRPKFEPRDARPSDDTTREIADFFRSTAPPNERHQVHSAGAGSQHTTRTESSNSAANDAKSAQSASVAARMAARSKESEEALKKSKQKPRLQAREPVVSDRSQTSELADFIREGPPGDSSRASTRSTLQPSVASSSNSRAPLIDTNKSSGPAKQRQPRKKGRVPDPYAIYDDDDALEELLEKEYYQQQEREEESLVDFLRDVPPPPDNDKPPEPFVLSGKNNKQASSSSGSGFRARFRRNPSVDMKGPSSKKSLSSIRSGNAPASPAQISTPIQQKPSMSSLSSAGNGSERGMPANSSYTSQVNRARGIPGPATQVRTGTSDLADFLRNTGPPEPIKSPTVEEKDSTFDKIFRRGKKANA